MFKASSETGELVALKRVSLGRNDTAVFNRILREVKALKVNKRVKPKKKKEEIRGGVCEGVYTCARLGLAICTSIHVFLLLGPLSQLITGEMIG